MPDLDHAMEIAEQAHRGQTDKTGKPYLDHCRRVADSVETTNEKIVAYLHDVVEKGHDCSPGQLERAGFAPRVVAAVDALTRRDGERDADFVRRAASDPLARAVKRADLEDNRRQALETGKSTEKYDKGLAILKAEFGA